MEWGIYTLDQIDWRRGILCCSCMMAWYIAVGCSCNHLWSMSIIHGRYRSIMIMGLKGEIRNIAPSGKDGQNDEDKGRCRKARVLSIVWKQFYAWTLLFSLVCMCWQGAVGWCQSGLLLVLGSLISSLCLWKPWLLSEVKVRTALTSSSLNRGDVGTRVKTGFWQKVAFQGAAKSAHRNCLHLRFHVHGHLEFHCFTSERNKAKHAD